MRGRSALDVLLTIIVFLVALVVILKLISLL